MRLSLVIYRLGLLLLGASTAACVNVANPDVGLYLKHRHDPFLGQDLTSTSFPIDPQSFSGNIDDYGPPLRLRIVATSIAGKPSLSFEAISSNTADSRGFMMLSSCKRFEWSVDGHPLLVKPPALKIEKVENAIRETLSIEVPGESVASLRSAQSVQWRVCDSTRALSPYETKVLAELARRALNSSQPQGSR